MLAPGPCRLPAAIVRWTHKNSQHSATHPTTPMHMPVACLPAVLLLLCDTALVLRLLACSTLLCQPSYSGDCRGGGSGGGPGGVAATCGRQAGWLCHCVASTPPTRCCWSTWQGTQGQTHEYQAKPCESQCKGADNRYHHIRQPPCTRCCRYSCTSVGCVLRSEVGSVHKSERVVGQQDFAVTPHMLLPSTFMARCDCREVCNVEGRETCLAPQRLSKAEHCKIKGA